jgi:hypothetical protein
MSTEKTGSIVEQTLLQIKAVENAISENAKGILASTMKQEISELVRESLVDSKQTKKPLNEQEEPEMEEPVVATADDEEEEEAVIDVEDEGGEPESEYVFGMDAEDGEEEGDNEMEMPPLDMTSASPDEVLKVFKAMGDEDGIIVKKDDDYIHLIDDEDEYLIQTGDMDDNTEEPMLDLEESVIYEIEMEEGDYHMEEQEFEEGDYHMEEQEFEEGDYHMEEQEFEEGDYHMEEQEFEEGDYMVDLDNVQFGQDDFSNVEEESIYEIDEEDLHSVVEAFKAVGMGMGKVGTGIAKTSVNNKGFKEDQPQGTKGVGMGKASKFKYPKIKHGVTETETEEAFEGWEMEEDVDLVDIEATEGMMEPETTEASRTMTYKRRAERDRVAAPSQLRKESVERELDLIKEKNEEYKKALNFFRSKLNEVAVFNSNLAYATRLFTEHSTTKQEKINILRRFDNVESIKESKTLYKSIKNELDGKGGEMVTESVQTKVNRTPANGSSTNLIESKTYENPQFMRMRDLMSKIK